MQRLHHERGDGAAAGAERGGVPGEAGRPAGRGGGHRVAAVAGGAGGPLRPEPRRRPGAAGRVVEVAGRARGVGPHHGAGPGAAGGGGGVRGAVPLLPGSQHERRRRAAGRGGAASRHGVVMSGLGVLRGEDPRVAGPAAPLLHAQSAGRHGRPRQVAGGGRLGVDPRAAVPRQRHALLRQEAGGVARRAHDGAGGGGRGGRRASARGGLLPDHRGGAPAAAAAPPARLLPRRGPRRPRRAPRRPRRPASRGRAPDDRLYGLPAASSSGGYADYVFRAAARELAGMELPPGPLPWRSLRNANFQELSLDLPAATAQGQGPAQGPALRFARVYGFRNIQTLLRQVKMGRCAYQYVEVMACPGGCLNGGGQIKPGPGVSPQQLIEQLEQVYAHQDVAARLPTDNPAVAALYTTWLGGRPGSPAARQLLHTSFREREKTVTAAVVANW